jgi:FkbM family methyltransferase
MTSNHEPSSGLDFGTKGRFSLLASLRQMIRENRRALPFRLAGKAAEKYLHAYYNEGFYEFERNGETFAVNTFKTWLNGRKPVIWDVGANTGQWALEALGLIPEAEVHSFEIIPSIKERLIENTKDLPNIHVHGVGLSDRAGEIKVHLNPHNTVTSSIEPRLGGRWFQEETVEVTCEITTADEMARRISPPGFVKIDVEGHELSVLRGAQQLLAGPDAPAMMQIEYGETYIPSGSTLKALYELVEPHGYSIGRLFPNHVHFKSYEYEDDNFRMGNLIAAKGADLKKLLS